MQEVRVGLLNLLEFGNKFFFPKILKTIFGTIFNTSGRNLSRYEKK